MTVHCSYALGQGRFVFTGNKWPAALDPIVNQTDLAAMPLAVAAR